MLLSDAGLWPQNNDGNLAAGARLVDIVLALIDEVGRFPKSRTLFALRDRGLDGHALPPDLNLDIRSRLQIVEPTRMLRCAALGSLELEILFTKNSSF